MRFRNLIKHLMCIFLFASSFANVVYAELLLFKAGDKASYTMSQKLESECESLDETTYSQSETTIELDIEILSLNKDIFPYPFFVEVTLRKISTSEVQQEGESSTLISYDSSGPRNLENLDLAKYIDKLINHPLVFKVEKDFQVNETSGYLTQIYDSFDSPLSVGLFGATPWTYELLLTQLFHLSGRNLKSTNLYPASCYEFLNWEDDPLDEKENILDQTSDYSIKTADSKKIEACWEGNAKVVNGELDMEGEVTVRGNVTWNRANPLKQKRDLEVKTDQTHYGSYPLHYKISAQQTWQPTS